MNTPLGWKETELKISKSNLLLFLELFELPECNEKRFQNVGIILIKLHLITIGIIIILRQAPRCKTYIDCQLINFNRIFF